MQVKLYEIAREAGVSISTVSRVLNNDKQKPASRATAERILETALRLGYFSAPPAPGRQEGKSLACVLTSWSDTFADNFFNSILLGVRDESNRLGYDTCHALSASNTSTDGIVGELAANAYDGVILLGRIGRNMLEEVKALTPNLIYAGLNRLNAGFDEVICDAAGAVTVALEHIIACGYSSIGYIGTIPQNDENCINEHRFSAFCNALKLHNLSIQRKFCKNISLLSQQAYTAACELVEEGNVPEALFCANDTVAIGVVSALQDRNLRVPEDVAIVGLDNIEVSNFMRPRLTTVNMQKYELGRFAVKMLHDRLTGQHTVPVVVELPYTLIVRESCPGHGAPPVREPFLNLEYGEGTQ